MVKEIICENCGKIFIGYHNSKYCESCRQSKARQASAKIWERTKRLREEQRNKKVVVTYDSNGVLFFVSEKKDYEKNLRDAARKLYQENKFVFPFKLQKRLVDAISGDDSKDIPVLHIYQEGKTDNPDAIYSQIVKIANFVFNNSPQKRGRKRNKNNNGIEKEKK